MEALLAHPGRMPDACQRHHWGPWAAAAAAVDHDLADFEKEAHEEEGDAAAAGSCCHDCTDACIAS